MTVDILDCMPMMADVISGAVPRPRELQDDENPVEWLIEATPAWRRLAERFDLHNTDFSVEDRPEMDPPANLGLSGFPHIYAMAWHERETQLRAAVLLVNPDGTRCAIIDAWDEIARLWDNVRRPDAGRPMIETDNPKTLAQRKWRQSRRR